MLCIWVSLFVGRLVSYGARISPRQEPQIAANRERERYWRIDPSPSTVLVPMAVPTVLAALNLARQMTTVVVELALIKWSFQRPLLGRAPATKMRFATVYCASAGFPSPPNPSNWVWKYFVVYAKEALANIAVCLICTYLVRTQADL